MTNSLNERGKNKVLCELQSVMNEGGQALLRARPEFFIDVKFINNDNVYEVPPEFSKRGMIERVFLYEHDFKGEQ